MSIIKTVTANMERIIKITPIIINIKPIEFISEYFNKNLRLCQQTFFRKKPKILRIIYFFIN
ncbi:hypothetical protein ATZ36_09555 [Candidatus Endomicrobiellum trichonymphae]|uniref:Uncharacterized protein n=1 Tax=Endomicrobium trichonymphae TaxID=1408204 RepID=A0A1E5IG16_ENDTX|nr:hypothetical protein ATZ36_09555 [Candidatus Endomicrobium trichonymphae]